MHQNTSRYLIFTCILCARFDKHMQTNKMQSKSEPFSYICFDWSLAVLLFSMYFSFCRTTLISDAFRCQQASRHAICMPHYRYKLCFAIYTIFNCNRNGESINTKLHMAHVSKESAGAHGRPCERMIVTPHYRHACLRFSISETKMFN